MLFNGHCVSAILYKIAAGVYLKMNNRLFVSVKTNNKKVSIVCSTIHERYNENTRTTAKSDILYANF